MVGPHPPPQSSERAGWGGQSLQGTVSPFLCVPLSHAWVSHHPCPYQRKGEAQIIDMSILGLSKPLPEKVPVISKSISMYLYLSFISLCHPTHGAIITSSYSWAVSLGDHKLKYKI